MNVTHHPTAPPSAPQAGFTLIEVLIATVLIAMTIGTAVLANINFSANNARTQLQTLEAGAAEGVAQKYANNLPKSGTTVSGHVTAALFVNALNADQLALLSHIDYDLSTSGQNVTLRVYRNDLPKDPSPLVIQAKEKL